MADPGKYFRNNVSGGLNLLSAMVEHGVNRIVFSSTCATFGVPERVPIDELTPQNPINPYGESKLIFERILHWFHRIHDLDFVTLRYFNVAGASGKYGEDHKTETHLIPRILQVALGQSPHAEIFGTDFETPDSTLRSRCGSPFGNLRRTSTSKPPLVYGTTRTRITALLAAMARLAGPQSTLPTRPIGSKSACRSFAPQEADDERSTCRALSESSSADRRLRRR